MTEEIDTQRYCVGWIAEECNELATECARGMRFGVETPDAPK